MGKALLIIVLGFSGIFTLVLFNATANQQRSSEALVTQYEKWIARNTVESVSNVALSKLYQDPNWNAGLSGTFNDATYNVTVDDVTIDSVHYAKKDSITITTTFEGESDTTITKTIQPAYSHYFYLTQNWPGSEPFPAGNLHGPVHSNAQIDIDNAVNFLSKVSSQQSTVDAPNAEFYGGAELGTAQIVINNTVVSPLFGSIPGATIHSFANDVTITFHNDGTYTNSITAGSQTVPDIIRTNNGSNDDITVRGQLDGKVTVASDRDIIINNDLTYLDPSDTSDDFLGLVARRDVKVNFIGLISTIDVNASIFTVRDLVVESTVSAFLTLNLKGSLALNTDDSFSVSGLSLGYTRTFVYDPRLREQTPPYFPRLTTHIEPVYRSN